MVWNQMPICISGKRRGEDTAAIKEKKHREIQQRNHTLRDMGRFLKVIGVPFPKSNEDIKTLYREMGSFLAASVILAHTPLEVMNMPEAGIQDSKEQMRFRAVCDERISLPLSAFKDHGDIYQKLAARLGQQSMLEVRVAWRCNHPLWWVAVADDSVAPDLYRKLGYSEGTVAALMALDSVPTVAHGTEGAVYPAVSGQRFQHCQRRLQAEALWQQECPCFLGQGGLWVDSLLTLALGTSHQGVWSHQRGLDVQGLQRLLESGHGGLPVCPDHWTPQGQGGLFAAHPG